MEDHKVRNTALKFHLLRVLQGLSLPVLRTWPLSFWLSSSAGVVDLGQTLSPPLAPFSLREGHLLALLLHLPRGQDLLWIPNPLHPQHENRAIAFGKTCLNDQKGAARCSGFLSELSPSWSLLFIFCKIKNTMEVVFPKGIACSNGCPRHFFLGT